LFRILVNLAPLKGGGGQTVALNFIKAAIMNDQDGVDYVFVVAKGSDIDTFLSKNSTFKKVRAPKSPLLRIAWELFFGWYAVLRVRPNIIYSCFGYAQILTKVPQVTGSADSNLYYPNINFWEDEPPLERLRRWLVDQYRKACLRQSSGVIYENPDMQRRSSVVFRSKPTVFIPPSFVQEKTEVKTRNLEPHPMEVTLLFLCGWQRNKNFMLIPEIILELKKRGLLVKVVFTAPLNGGALHEEFLRNCRDMDVSGNLELSGPIPNEKLPDYYSRATVVCLLSRLESFSNNIVESWLYRRPLLISDLPWARAICGDGAVYVNRDSASDISDKVCMLLRSKERYQAVVSRGLEELGKLPSQSERHEMELSFLRGLCE
jgi:glycosyltransferase involved in cell wall biosynthesis